MSKEMIVSCSSHETKIAILEDDQLAELYFERGEEYTLAGSIYKGKVTRVLPGMQSAFVNIGLERDAFLYVSDFLEDAEEYDKIATSVEEKVIRMEENAPVAEATIAPSAVVEPSSGEIVSGTQSEVPGVSARTAVPTADKAASERRHAAPERGSEQQQRFSRRSRRRRHHKGFPESKYARPHQPSSTADEAADLETPTAAPIILPGESLAKYKSRSQPETEGSETRQEERAAEDSAAESSTETSEQRTESGLAAAEAAASESVYESEKPEEVLPPQDFTETLSNQEPALAEQPEPDRSGEDSAMAPAQEPVESEEARAEAVSSDVSRQDFSAVAEIPTPPFEEPPVSDAGEEELPVETTERQPDLQAEEEPSSTDGPALEGSSLASEDAGAIETGELENPPAAEPEAEAPAAPAARQSASVRERRRNPRYTRKARWLTRKRDQAEIVSRGGGRATEREPGQPMIADILKEGQEILVQIAKEPLGKKGARITSHIALPGRYLVYMPTVDHIGVSRKISSEEERQRLKHIMLENSKGIPGGFIVRTAGEGRSKEDFRQDILYLSNLWAEIKTQAEKVSAPALLHHDLNLVLRILRDQLSDEFSAVWVDNEQEYERILSLVSKFQPGLVHRVKLYTKDVPLFEELGIEEEISKALKPKVWLKSGGYIVINQTEALVAIDVNTGKFVGKSNRLEDTIVKTNLEAIKEIVRQVRLRDLGGIIVIDFIDMGEKKNRQKVMAATEEALRNDRSPSKILSFNEFGLVAITRKRVRQSLERTLCQPCSYCGGSGLVKSVTTVCYEILSEARKTAPQLERKQITLRVNPEVGRALKARDSRILPEIEEMTGKPVIVRNDPTLHVENFDFN